MKKLFSLVKEFGPSIAMLGLPLLASAQIPSPLPPRPSVAVPTTNINSLQSVLDSVCIAFGWFFVFLIALAVIFVVVAAFKYLTAGGDPEKVKGAGSTLLYAAIAVGVALLARAIPLVIGTFLGAGQISSC